jgi:hypothetical protein
LLRSPVRAALARCGSGLLAPAGCGVAARNVRCVFFIANAARTLLLCRLRAFKRSNACARVFFFMVRCAEVEANDSPACAVAADALACRLLASAASRCALFCAHAACTPPGTLREAVDAIASARRLLTNDANRCALRSADAAGALPEALRGATAAAPCAPCFFAASRSCMARACIARNIDGVVLARRLAASGASPPRGSPCFAAVAVFCALFSAQVARKPLGALRNFAWLEPWK